MSEHYRSNHGKSVQEKIGFYAAFAICLIAVCMAVYSTYRTIVGNDSGLSSSMRTQQVNQPVTGVKQSVPVPTIGFPTEKTDEYEADVTFDVAEETTEEAVKQYESTTEISKDEALRTMLSTDISLDSPVKNGKVIKKFSKDSIYYKTLNVWKPHNGVDFDGELGENVYAMAQGEVTKVYEDKMSGKTVEISVNEVVCRYCGLGSCEVKTGDKVEKGDKIGVIGSVPFESDEQNHVHVEVKVNGKYSDPLNFIGNND